LRAVEDDGHAGLGQGRGRDAPADPAHVGDGDQHRARPDRVGHVAERHHPDGRAARAGVDERADQAGVLLVGGDHLVARAEVEPGEHAAEAVGRRRGERHLLLRRAQQPRVRGPQLSLRPQARGEVRGDAAFLQLGVQRPARRLDGGRGQRAVRAAVQVGHPRAHGELRSQGCRVHARPG
jgi:hypothetical protein